MGILIAVIHGYDLSDLMLCIFVCKYYVLLAEVYMRIGSVLYPQLLSLDLSNNRLQRLEMYADLSAKCSELQVLNLSTNQIRSPVELEHMSGLKKLTTLVLENNPLSQQNVDFASYSSNLRKIFPALQLLVSTLPYIPGYFSESKFCNNFFLFGI